MEANMKSILEEIYFGRRGDFEKIVVDERYEKADEKYSKIYNELVTGLNESQRQILDKLVDATAGLEIAIGCSHFKEGFKIGVLVAVETFG